MIGAGYALIVSLAWRTREAAVLAIEHRDGVKFYVVPNSALRPIELVRTPGLRSDRLPTPLCFDRQMCPHEGDRPTVRAACASASAAS